MWSHRHNGTPQTEALKQITIQASYGQTTQSILTRSTQVKENKPNRVAIEIDLLRNKSEGKLPVHQLKVNTQDPKENFQKPTSFWKMRIPNDGKNPKQ